MSRTPREVPAELTWLASAWNLPLPKRRGPKPAHSVGEIIDAAIALADADGITAVSLPKIAASIGVTTNALYRYVASKEELLLLLCDAGIGPAPALPGARGWRAVSVNWVHAVLQRYRAHPWLLDLPIQGAPVTPNLLAWVEILLEGLDDRLDGRQKLGCVLLLDNYARGFARLARDLDASEQQHVQAVAELLEPVLQERGLSLLASMFSRHEYADGYDDEDIDFGLQRILDGIGVLIDSAGK